MFTKNLLLILILLIATTGLKAYSGGNGTESDPYQIATLNDLKQLSETENDWNKNFKQIADIDASETENWNDGKGFPPIGKFKGIYEGANHQITGLYIKRATDYDIRIALFAVLEGAKVSNLILENIFVEGANSVGGLVGTSRYGSVIENCSTSGIIKTCGNNPYVNLLCGGLAGYLKDNCKIENSFSSCNVEGCKYVGGLVGSVTLDCTVLNSYAIGAVNGDIQTGGLVGECFYNSTIQNCYSTGEVSGEESTGGLIGRLENATVTDSYWNIETSTQTSSAGGEGKTTSEMKNISTYENWDFTNIWKLEEDLNDGYPILYWQSLNSIEEPIPASTLLTQNYPNPFNPTTTIKFYSGTSAKVELAVYNSQGELVKKLLDGKIKSGYHSIKFDGSNLNSGIYYYRLIANDKVFSKKMILIK